MRNLLAFLLAVVGGVFAFQIVRIVPQFLGVWGGGAVISEAIMGYLQGGCAALMATSLSAALIKDGSTWPTSASVLTLLLASLALSVSMLTSGFTYDGSRGVAVASAISVPIGIILGWHMCRKY